MEPMHYRFPISAGDLKNKAQKVWMENEKRNKEPSEKELQLLKYWEKQLPMIANLGVGGAFFVVDPEDGINYEKLIRILKNEGFIAQRYKMFKEGLYKLGIQIVWGKNLEYPGKGKIDSI